MLRHIVAREIFDHIHSLRFALTTLIIVVLMVTNAVVHLQQHPERFRQYSENVTKYRSGLRSQTQLYSLLREGPGTLWKRPSSLAFVAAGGDAMLPGRISDDGGSWEMTFNEVTVKSIWWLEYPTVNPNAKSLLPRATMIDWTFIITYLLSFIALLFTFDAISGERERGTLRLCLANPISRPLLLVGKFLGTFITILFPFAFAVLLNLTVISTDSWTQLSDADWGRLGLIVLIASIYAGIFIAGGLMVSASTRDSQVSLVVVLLMWVTLVVFTPSTLGTLATKWMVPVQTPNQLERTKQAGIAQLDTEINKRLANLREEPRNKGNFFDKLMERTKSSSKEPLSPPKHPPGLPAPSISNVDSPNASRHGQKDAEELAPAAGQKLANERLSLKADRVNKDVALRERLNREHFASQIAQVRRARGITRFSPASIVQYALESMAGTGLNRHLQFLEGVQRHIKQFRHFIIETDYRDTASRHIIGIPEGMSKKPISSEALPIFEDEITFTNTFNAAVVDILLLVLLLGVFLLGAFLIFVRSEV